MSSPTYHNLLKFFFGAFLALPVATIFSWMPAEADVLKGGVNKGDFINPGNGGPALNRNDINKVGDPFGSSGTPPQNGNEAFDAPGGAFQVPTLAPPPPKKPLSGNAQDSGGQPNFGQMQPTPDNMPHNFAPPMQGNLQQGGPNPNDPDDTAEMKLAWDTWHHNVAQTIYQRFNTLSSKFFSKGAPLAANVAYTVTRDGHIANAHLTQKSPNIIFNTMILTVVNSINGDQSVLQFPPGSHRMTVDKAGVFTVGYTNVDGFKFTTNDSETVQTKVPHNQMQPQPQQRPMAPQWQQFQQQPQQFQQQPQQFQQQPQQWQQQQPQWQQQPPQWQHQ